MGRIHVLNDLVVNRIAAGEVVERPASVVKELVENSLDAGARSVEIVLSAGGRRLIRVADDGEGMDRDDALLALERHATSKLRSHTDLEQIQTLGFRGEALPSIAAVSRFLLRTAIERAVGTEIEVRGGRILEVREVVASRGTVVEVASLFFNTPGRRKFLKSEATELAHAVRAVTRYALARCDVRFRVEHDGRVLLDAGPTTDPLARIAAIYGADLAETLLPVEFRRGNLGVRGRVARPADATGRKDLQNVFVNGRAVQDRVLAHAISEAYGNTVSRDRRPAVFLFVEIDRALLDVNVHPQKTEVRFARSWEVHDGVREAIGAALAVLPAIPSYSDLRSGAGARAETADAAAAAFRYLELHEGPRTADEPSSRPAPRSAAPSVELPWRSGVGTPPEVGEGVDEPSAAHAGPEASGPLAERHTVALAQLRESYILAQDDSGLLVVDQHAAHERVLFERYLADAEENRVEIQRLLFPVMVDLPPHERVLLEEEAEEFARLGFLLEPFGGNSIRMDAVPAVAADLDPAELLRTLIGEAGRTRAASSGIAELRRKLVTTAACHAAIKIRHPLAREGMQGLLDDLFRASNPTTCPHGRPILFRFPLEELERAFRRR